MTKATKSLGQQTLPLVINVATDVVGIPHNIIGDSCHRNALHVREIQYMHARARGNVSVPAYAWTVYLHCVYALCTCVHCA